MSDVPPLPTPSFGARVRAWGFVGLWVLEWGANCVQGVLFFARRRALRRRMAGLIQGSGRAVERSASERSGASG